MIPERIFLEIRDGAIIAQGTDHREFRFGVLDELVFGPIALFGGRIGRGQEMDRPSSGVDGPDEAEADP